MDNNSTDCSIDILREFGDNIIIKKNNQNLGFAKANNQGMDLAKGKYLLILNNDTIFIENTLKKILEVSQRLERDFIVGCKLLNEDGTNQVSIVDFENIGNVIGENLFLYKLFPKSKLFNRFHLNYKSIYTITEVDIVKGAFLFCKNETYKALEGFDENFYFYAEEADLCKRLKKRGGNVFFFPETSIIHLGGATTDKIPWFKYKNQCIAKIKFYQKHYSGITFATILSFHYFGIFIRIPLYLLGGIFLLKKNLIVKGFYYFKQLFIYPKNIY